MAGDIQYQPQIAALLADFKAGAQLYAEAIEIEDNEAADEGKMASRAAVQALDAQGPHGRDVLIPLLDDPDPAIRVAAAAYLVKIVPQRALAELRNIQDTCRTRTHMTAFHLLWAYEHGDLNL
jgi:hypothetical protein